MKFFSCYYLIGDVVRVFCLVSKTNYQSVRIGNKLLRVVFRLCSSNLFGVKLKKVIQNYATVVKKF